MSPAQSIRLGLLSLSLVMTAVACGDSTPASPDEGSDPIKNLVQVQSPDTARAGVSSAKGDGSFHGFVRGYNEADFPDTLKSVKALANVVVTAYPAELTNGDPKLGPAAATVSTSSDGQFTFPTLKGGLYVVTFVPAKGDSYASAWTQATAHPQSGDLAWIIMLRAR